MYCCPTRAIYQRGLEVARAFCEAGTVGAPNLQDIPSQPRTNLLELTLWLMSLGFPWNLLHVFQTLSIGSGPESRCRMNFWKASSWAGLKHNDKYSARTSRVEVSGVRPTWCQEQGYISRNRMQRTLLTTTLHAASPEIARTVTLPTAM